MNSLIVVIFALIVVILLLIIWNRQRKINSLKTSLKSYSEDIGDFINKMNKLNHEIKYQEDEIKVLANFVGESLHHKIVCYSDFGNKEIKEVAWLIDITSKLRVSSSGEKFNILLDNSRFKEENDILKKEIEDTQELSKITSVLGLVAFNLEKRIDKIIAISPKP